jgi:hypothetical protein
LDTESPQVMIMGDLRAPGCAVGGPVPVAWRESALTRAKELESLSAWMLADEAVRNRKVLGDGITCHLTAARQAAEAAKLEPHRPFGVFRSGALKERAISNLDAAEALLRPRSDAVSA